MRFFGLVLSLLCFNFLTAWANSNQHLINNSEFPNQSSVTRFLQNDGKKTGAQSVNKNFNTENLEANQQGLQFGTFKHQEPKSNSQIQGKSDSQSKQSNLQRTEKNPGVLKEEAKILVTEIDKPVLGKGLKVNDGASYQRIHIGQLQKKFLFIDLKLSERDQWQKVAIIIFVEENGAFNKLKQCQYDGHDSCYISNGQLKKDSTLMLAIKCQDECTYNFNSHWSDLQHLSPGTSYVFTFGKSTFQLYHVQLENKDFQEFRVHVSPRTTRRPFDNIKIYGKYGSETGVSRENFDFQSVNLWEDGQGLFLSSKNLKSTNFDLLLVGQSQSTYQISCQLITQPNHQIEDGEHIYQYLNAGDSKSYHIATFDTKRFQEFSLKVSVLAGNVQVEYFYDKELQKRLPYEPFKYMYDSEFIFQSNQVTSFADNGVYLKIASHGLQGQTARDATYTIKFESRQKSDAVELKEHVYGFVTVNDTKFAFFNFKRWLQQTQANLKFTVSVIQVLGKSNLQFLICKDKLHICTDSQKYKTATDPIRKGQTHEEISQKERYQFQIPDSSLKKINNLEQEGIIVVRITRQVEKDSKINFSLIALQFINNNKVLILREGRPLEDKLAANQMKIYKYINSDENVKEIRIHVNQIAGIIKLNGLIKDPFSQKTIAVQPQGTTLRFVSNLTSPIIVSIRADSRAIFGISMQIILKNEGTGIADVRAIGQDLAYTVRISPNSFTIFEITPMFYQFLFKYESSQTIIVCAINMTTGECLNINNTINSIFTEKGEILKAQISKERKARVKITNPFSDSIAQVTVIFHSRTFKHCDQKKVGKAYSQYVQNGACYSYILQGEENSGLQLYISKRQLANMSYSVLICGNSVKDAYKLKTLTFSSELIDTQCQQSIQAKKIDVFWYVNTDNAGMKDYSVKVDFVVQKTGGIVILPEGLSYSVLMKAREGILKTFGYSLINKIDARVYIHQNIGKFKAFAKVISQDDREIEDVSEINFHASSITTNNYEQQPVILVTQKMIEDVRCVRCFLMIAVYTQSQDGRTIQFQIEVIQKYQSLNDDTSVKGYLQAGSLAYYTYRAKESKGTSLLFFLSDHHQRCANMYLALNQNPGSKFFIAKAIEANQLVYIHNGTQTKYFLAVEAKNTCDYALSVLQLDTSVHRLERGKQNMLKLLKGQARYFTFQQYTEEPFKILSLSKFGEVRLHLNVSGISPNKRTFTIDQLDTEKFEVKSQYPNALAVSTSDKVYCKNCDYFLAAEALSTTFATLFLVYPQTVVPLLKNKFFSDYILKKNETTLASYNQLQKSKLQVMVYSGSIEITAIYKEYKTSVTFSAKSDIQSMIIDIGDDIIKGVKGDKFSKDSKVDPYFNSMKSEVNQEKIPINFILKALSDKTSYTLQIKSVPVQGDLSGFAQYQNIRAGEPNHIQITSDRVFCLDGILRSFQEEIYVTTSSDNKEKLLKLIFNAKVSGKQGVKIEKQVMKNVVSLKIVDPSSQNETSELVHSYQVCMKYENSQDQQQNSKKTQQQKQQIVKSQENTSQVQGFQEEIQSFKAVVTQANEVNILASDIETLVKGNNTFIVHSDGDFILDVFQCKGEAKISYSDSLASLKSAKPKLLEAVSFSEQRHALKVIQKEVTFINITSQHALIRWLPLNVQNDLGSGYLRFSAGDVKYSSKFKQIHIEYQPLQIIKKTKSKIQQITYNLYITNDSQKLQYAAQCSSFKQKQVIQVTMKQITNKVNNGQERQYMNFAFEKTTLDDNFKNSQNIYFTIVANLVLQVSANVQKAEKFKTSISDEHEHYRFIYNRQQLPLQTYKPTQIQTIPYTFLGLIVVSVLVILAVITFILTKKIFPWIAKLRSSNLVEEHEQGQNKDDLEIVPPSSYRNQRAPETVQTEQKMSN